MNSRIKGELSCQVRAVTRLPSTTLGRSTYLAPPCSASSAHLATVVTVREAFLHCGKALKRSKLWHDDYRVDKRSLPSLGRMIVEQTRPANMTVEQADAVVEEGYQNKLY